MMTHTELDALAAWLRELGGGGRVLLTREGPLAVLTLDHPEAANALSTRMMADLWGAVAELEQDSGLCALLLRGSGGQAFCAGSDLRVVRQFLDSPALARDLSRFMQEVTRRILQLPLVSVAVLEGPAVGGGAELATCCQHRILAEGATVRFIHASLGLVPGWGGGWRLVGLLGRRVALRLLSTAAPVGAAEALALGLVDEIAPAGQAEAAARRFLAPVLANPVASVRAACRLVAGGSPDDAEQERELFVGLWGGPAMREALARARSGR